MTKLGTFEYLPIGNEWTGGRPGFKVTCTGGYLLVYEASVPDGISEVCVDFVSDDNRLIQLAAVGRDEFGKRDAFAARWPDYQPMHIYCYDGMDEGVASTQYVTINEDSHWYEL